MKAILSILMILLLLHPAPGIGKMPDNMAKKASAGCMMKLQKQKKACHKSKSEVPKNCSSCAFCPLLTSYISPAAVRSVQHVVYRSVTYPELKRDKVQGVYNSVWRPPIV